MTLRRGGKRPRPPESIAAMLPEVYWHPPGPGEKPGEQHLMYGLYLEDLAEECQSITGNRDLSEVVGVARLLGASPADWYKRCLCPFASPEANGLA